VIGWNRSAIQNTQMVKHLCISEQKRLVLSAGRARAIGLTMF
jgi:hypothetical protein